MNSRTQNQNINYTHESNDREQSQEVYDQSFTFQHLQNQQTFGIDKGQRGSRNKYMKSSDHTQYRESQINQSFINQASFLMNSQEKVQIQQNEFNNKYASSSSNYLNNSNFNEQQTKSEVDLVNFENLETEQKVHLDNILKLQEEERNISKKLDFIDKLLNQNEQSKNTSQNWAASSQRGGFGVYKSNGTSGKFQQNKIDKIKNTSGLLRSRDDITIESVRQAVERAWLQKSNQDSVQKQDIQNQSENNENGLDQTQSNNIDESNYSTQQQIQLSPKSSVFKHLQKLNDPIQEEELQTENKLDQHYSNPSDLINGIVGTSNYNTQNQTQTNFKQGIEQQRENLIQSEINEITSNRNNNKSLSNTYFSGFPGINVQINKLNQSTQQQFYDQQRDDRLYLVDLNQEFDMYNQDKQSNNQEIIQSQMRPHTKLSRQFFQSRKDRYQNIIKNQRNQRQSMMIPSQFSKNETIVGQCHSTLYKNNYIFDKIKIYKLQKQSLNVYGLKNSYSFKNKLIKIFVQKDHFQKCNFNKNTKYQESNKNLVYISKKNISIHFKIDTHQQRYIKIVRYFPSYKTQMPDFDFINMYKDDEEISFSPNERRLLSRSLNTFNNTEHSFQVLKNKVLQPQIDAQLNQSSKLNHLLIQDESIVYQESSMNQNQGVIQFKDLNSLKNYLQKYSPGKSSQSRSRSKNISKNKDNTVIRSRIVEALSDIGIEKFKKLAEKNQRSKTSTNFNKTQKLIPISQMAVVHVNQNSMFGNIMQHKKEQRKIK